MTSALVAHPAMEMGFATDVPDVIIGSKPQSVDYFSDEDENEEDNDEDYAKILSESPSIIIAEAQRILLRGTSSIDEDDENNNSNVDFDDSKNRSGILMKTDNNGVPGKQKKSVKFNMDLNETIEFEKDSGNDHNICMESGKLLDNVLDAGDLAGTDSESSSSDDEFGIGSAKSVKFAFNEENKESDDKKNVSAESSHPVTISDVHSKCNSSKSEQVKLEEDLEYLKNEYDREVVWPLWDQLIQGKQDPLQCRMQKLREEYETRRTDYLLELDELRADIDQKRKYFEQEIEESDKRKFLDEKHEELKKEEERLLKNEEDQKKRKEQYLEQERELDDYEQYLNRRHHTLKDKDADLKILQDELEELSEILRKRKKKLNSDNLRISEQLVIDNDRRLESYKETEINDLNKKVQELEALLRSCKNEKEKKENHCQEIEEKLQDVETENKKLKQKIKHLETELSLNLKNDEPIESHYLRRTSMLTAASRLNLRSNGELTSPRSPQLGSPASPRSNRTSNSQGSPTLVGRMGRIREPPSSVYSDGTGRSTNPGSRGTEQADTRHNKAISRTCVVM